MVKTKDRIYYLDNIRILLSVLVVTVHIALSYAPEVWWFFKSERNNHQWFLFYYEIVSTFCMGFFFLISGYFVAAAYKRKGGKVLLGERTKFCLVTILLGVFLIVLPLHYIYHLNFREGMTTGFADYLFNIFFGVNGKPLGWNDKWLNIWPDFKFAHIWFMEHIWVYTAVYVILMKILEVFKIKVKNFNIKLRWTHIMLFILLSTVITFIIRIYNPLDFWGAFLGFIQTEYANAAKYILFTIVGAGMYSFHMLENFPKRIGFICFGIGMFLWVFSLMGAGKISFIAAKGGYHYGSFLWSLYDCTMNTLMYMGIIALFKYKFEKTSILSRLLAKSSFGVYLLHVPVITLMQLMLKDLKMNIGMKFIVESVVGTILSFLVSIFCVKLIGMIRGKVMGGRFFNKPYYSVPDTYEKI